MQSLYDAILTTLNAATFSIADVTARKPYDESPKTYPMIVLHEIVNVAKNYGTVNGETRTVLAYQLDILTQDCLDTSNNALNRWEANSLLKGEVVDLLDTAYKFTRRSDTGAAALAADVVESKVRGDCVLDSYGNSYRP